MPSAIDDEEERHAGAAIAVMIIILVRGRSVKEENEAAEGDALPV